MVKQHSNSDVIMITGASAGVGRATAIKFAQKGCHIGLYARGRQGLNGVLKDVESHGGKGIILEGDVANFYQFEAAFNRLEQEFGPVNIMINNAMTTIFSEFLDISPEDFKRVTDVTYLGYVYGTQVALKSMLKRNKGTIVQIGSALAYRAIPLQSAYCGAKHAIEGFTESVRSELEHHHKNIHITMVQLPAINTPQFNWCKNNLSKKSKPVAPIYQPEVAADAIYWAAYHRRREMTLGGRTVIILWGNRFFPGLGDKYLAKTGYDSQMRKEDENKNRAFNLFQPVEGNFGAHGEFDDQAKTKSFQLWLITHLWALYLLIGILIILIILLTFIF